MPFFECQGPSNSAVASPCIIHSLHLQTPKSFKALCDRNLCLQVRSSQYGGTVSAVNGYPTKAGPALVGAIDHALRRVCHQLIYGGLLAFPLQSHTVTLIIAIDIDIPVCKTSLEKHFYPCDKSLISRLTVRIRHL